MESYYLVSGQAISPLAPQQFADLFQAPSAHLRESSHYAEGCYVLIETGKTHITFEKIDANEVLIAGDSELAAELAQVCQMVSAKLTQAHVQHRLELYNHAGIQYGYLHYQWPTTA